MSPRRTGFWGRLFGRTEPVAPDLDQLFTLPSAAITLEVSAGMTPTGEGSVCFRAAEGGAFTTLQQEVRALLDADQGPPVEISRDDYGYTWLVARHPPDEMSALVTDLHAVNRALTDAGFGPQLLCSLVGFRDAHGDPLALVYLYKRGTFYPFAPRPGHRRDNTLELQVRGLLANDLPIEADVSRWFPLWGAPGLTS